MRRIPLPVSLRSSSTRRSNAFAIQQDTVSHGCLNAPMTSVANDLRTTFNSGRTRPLAWRKQQLEQMVKMLEENESVFLVFGLRSSPPA
jgi:hypothetical protein